MRCACLAAGVTTVRDLGDRRWAVMGPTLQGIIEHLDD
jgi:hypothetical protein